ncbi:hypothetical protein GCM10009555_013190 [Acrocarpospora macrocephala]|uniref:Uncharacterized protein n=1 Tax=Acrocarpospora macrocephala TaxID=150177 RepID=A0A5M3WPC4_9ACTN|nr:hypothetical protein [Acrocarpospora macrocephala]GES08128.1 hypothetical protein Amac_017230 [Acrocarpospora macrocephala]
MTSTELRLRDVYPHLTANIVALLAPDPLAATVDALPYLGRCTCTPTCVNLLTAPPGSAGYDLIELERGDEPVIWLNLNPSRTAIVDIEVLDPRELTTTRPVAQSTVVS